MIALPKWQTVIGTWIGVVGDFIINKVDVGLSIGGNYQHYNKYNYILNDSILKIEFHFVCTDTNQLFYSLTLHAPPVRPQILK